MLVLVLGLGEDDVVVCSFVLSVEVEPFASQAVVVNGLLCDFSKHNVNKSQY